MAVTDDDGKLFGMVTLADVESAVAKGDIKAVTVGDIASRSLIVAYPDEYLHDVLLKLGAKEVGRIPVVERKNPKHLLGILRRQDIIRAYIKPPLRTTR